MSMRNRDYGCGTLAIHSIAIGTMIFCFPSPIIAQSETSLIQPGSCAVIVASRQTLSDANDFISRNLSDHRDVRVFESSNGWLAVSIGTLSVEEQDVELAIWRSQGRIPDDAYCSLGSRFVEELDWQQFADSTTISGSRDIGANEGGQGLQGQDLQGQDLAGQYSADQGLADQGLADLPRGSDRNKPTAPLNTDIMADRETGDPLRGPVARSGERIPLTAGNGRAWAPGDGCRYGSSIEGAPTLTPTTDFEDNGDGTVLHLRTGLVWYRCPVGMYFEPDPKPHYPYCETAMFDGRGVDRPLASFEEMQKWVGELQVGGRRWRLPTVEELETIVEPACTGAGLAINDAVFPGYLGDSYWTTDRSEHHPDGMRVVNFRLTSSRLSGRVPQPVSPWSGRSTPQPAWAVEAN